MDNSTTTLPPSVDAVRVEDDREVDATAREQGERPWLMACRFGETNA